MRFVSFINKFRTHGERSLGAPENNDSERVLPSSMKCFKCVHLALTDTHT
jgi:hypothetical protein